MHQCNASSSDWMRLNGRSVGNCIDLNAKLFSRSAKSIRRRILDDERPTIKFTPREIEWLLSCFNGHFFQTVTQRSKRVVSIVIDKEHRAGTVDSPGRANLTSNAVHWRSQDLRISDSDYLNIPEFAHGPRSIVVNISLRIVRCPVLIIQQR